MIGTDGSMDMRTFYIKAIGSSHILLNKPCQDNGLYYNKDGIYMAIISDGHGGESYIRSDRGSKIAVEIARDNILEFIESIPEELFKEKKGAITSVPRINPLKDKNGNDVDFSTLSESNQELAKQNKYYVTSLENCKKQEQALRTLFLDIYEAWVKAIKEDLLNDPLSTPMEIEHTNVRVEKIYGATLMAAVRTSNYWFAFQIGDGKLFACNRLMEWSEPVPWDCNCFMNVTTSLCDKDPEELFRYAFDGTGDFPMAFVLGSDGIDDSLIKTDLIHDFYSNMLQVFNEMEQTKAEENLMNYLSLLSKKGSHDDMSIAAIIEMQHIPKAIKYYNIISKARKLTVERDKKKEAIRNTESKFKKLKDDLENTSSKRDKYAKSTWKWSLDVLQEKKLREEEYSIISSETDELNTQLKQVQEMLNKLKEDYELWYDEKKTKVNELKEEATTIKENIKASKDFVCNPNTPNGEFKSTDGNNNETEATKLKNATENFKNNKSDINDIDLKKMNEVSDSQSRELLNKKDKS